MKYAFIFSIVSIIFFFQKEVLSQNQTIQDFTLVNAIDNQPISLGSFKGKRGVVVIFTGNYCPYSKRYESRILKLVDVYSKKGIQFLLVNSNNDKVDNIEEMAKKARSWGNKCPYLADKRQEISKMFGATKTPEAFVLKNSGSVFEIVYKGALDDNPQVAQDVNNEYLKNALDALLLNKMPQIRYKRAIGCMIKND